MAAYVIDLAAYVIDKHHKRISHVHTKDVRYSVIEKLGRTQESFLDAVVKGAFTVPGDGSLDFAAIVGRLASYGCEGWFVVEAEQDPKISPPLEMARKGHAVLMRVMALADTRSSLEPHRWKGLQDPSLRAWNAKDGRTILGHDAVIRTYSRPRRRKA